MKIRSKLFVNNLLVSLVPIMAVLLVMQIVLHVQATSAIGPTLQNAVDSMRAAIDRQADSYRNYALFYARSFYQLGVISSGITSYPGLRQQNMVIDKQDIKLIEFSLSNSMVYRRWASLPENLARFISSDTILSNMWKYMQNPFYAIDFISSFPDVVSNTLVIRNVAIISEERSEDKRGLAILSFPLDIRFLETLPMGNQSVVAFIQTENGIVTGNEEMNRKKTADQISAALINETRGYGRVSLGGQGSHFIMRVPLYGVKDKVIAQLGVLYSEKSFSAPFDAVRYALLLLFLISLALMVFLTLFFSRRMLTPILNLKTSVDLFRTRHEYIRQPDQVFDEIGELRSAFNEMARDILHYQRTIEDNSRVLNEYYAAMKRDLLLAQKIQQTLIPSPSLSFERAIFYSFYKPQGDIGGDLFDISTVKPGVIRVLVADATGHGVQAALITMIIKGEYEKMKSLIQSPAELLEILNSEFIDNFRSLTVFFSLFLCDIDTNSRTLTYASAGHPDQLLLNGKTLVHFPRTGRLVGVDRDVVFQGKTVNYHPGDRLLLYSDGLTEQINSLGEEYGEDRLCENFRAIGALPPEETVRELLKHQQEFRGTVEVSDDLTLIACELS